MSYNDKTKIQTLIFDGRYFNKRKVKDWINKKGFKLMKRKKDPIDTEKKITNEGKCRYYRVRQCDPARFKKSTFRNIKLRKGVNAIIGKRK